MKLFLLDLWADLREKRLWPVAALLAIGLVAVPLVVAKPAAEPQPAGPDPAQQAEQLPEAGVKVLAAKDATGTGSALDLFDPKDPFRPPEAVINEGKPGQSADSQPAGDGDGDGGGGSAQGDSGGSASDDIGFTDTGGGSGGGSAPGGSAPTTPTVKTEHYAYVADLTFRNGERLRRIRGFRRLNFLPSESTPLLLFLGISSDLNNAVFLVDSTLEANGEGRCKPDGEKCSLLYLGPGELHYFTEDDGDTYALQVDQIRRIKVSGRASSSSQRKGRKPRSGQSSPPEGQSSPPKARRSFIPPIFADLVSVATQGEPR
jgi:hypothetical protein